MTKAWHFRALPEPLFTPFDQLGAYLIRLLLLRPMAATANQIFLEVGHDLFHAVGRRRRQHMIVFSHDHQRRHPDRVVDPGRALPVARHVAIPIDAAGEAGLAEGVNEHLLFVGRQDRRARIVLGIVAGNHLRKRQVEPGRGSDASGWRLGRRGFAARYWLAHKGIESLLDPAIEYVVDLTRGVLKLHDIHVLAETLPEQLDRVGRRTVGVRRVDAHYARDTIDMPQWHLPDDKTAPVVANENCLLDVEMVEQTDEIAGQVLDIVSFDGLRPLGGTVATLVRRDHANAGIAERLELVAPRKRDLRPAMAKNERRLIALGTRFVIAHANSVGLRELQRRHFYHRQLTSDFRLWLFPLKEISGRTGFQFARMRLQLATLFKSAGGANAVSRAANSPGSMSQSTWTWGMMLAPAMKPKSN